MPEIYNGIDAYEFANLRHDYSRAYSNGDIYKTDGFLTAGERRLCREMGMVLPKPVNPQDVDIHTVKIYDLDLWMCRIGATVDGDPSFGVWLRENTWDVDPHPVYIVDGVIDVVHGGHYKVATAAFNLAKQNGGYVYFLIQPNSYVKEFKKKLPIFDEVTRAMWFRNQSTWVDGSVVWDQGHSWEFGYEILGQLMNPSNKKKNIFRYARS